MKLSIIIPVYNEEKTIERIVKKIISKNLGGVKKEIIIVDDGSSDKSPLIIQRIAKDNRTIKTIKKTKNEGKGTAVGEGIKVAKGEYILIQDADLEYDPEDIPVLLEPILDKSAQVVYGTRLNRLPNFSRDERTLKFFVQYVGNKFLSLTTSIMFGQWLTDMETCYKLFPSAALSGIQLKAKRFDFEPEITAKLLKKGFRIKEVPISTNPRNYKEGKKLSPFHDGPIALWTLLKYRFVN